MFAQTRSVFLALVLILILMLIVNFFKFISTFKLKRRRISFSDLSLFLWILGFLYFLIVNLPLDLYLENYFNYLLSPIKNLEELSFQGRINSFNLFLIEISNDLGSYIIGKGYKEQWLDVPLIQAFRDLGIIGGFSLLLFHILLVFQILKCFKVKIRKPHYYLFSTWYILLFINSLSHGQPYDYSFWLPFLTMIRFLNPARDYAKI